MGKQMPYEGPDGIDTEEAQQTSHLPGTVAKWISFARALSGPKTNLSDKRHIFCYVNCSGLGGLALERHGNVRGTLGFGSEYHRSFRFASHKHCSFVVSFYFSWTQNCSHFNQALRLLVSLGSPAHIARYYLNAQFPCPGSEHLHVQEGKFLFLGRLKGSLELLRALNDSQRPGP